LIFPKQIDNGLRKRKKRNGKMIKKILRIKMIKESGGSLKVQRKLLCAMCYKVKERLQRNVEMTKKG
jgi:hypothetical protein